MRCKRTGIRQRSADLRLVPILLVTSGQFVPKKKAGEQHKATPRQVRAPPPPTAFSADRTAAPKVSVVPLQGLDLVGVNAAVGVHMDCHLVEVVGAPPLEGHQLPDVREVNMEHIAIQSHFPHIGPHIGNARLGHAFPDQRLLLRRHHHTKMDTAAAFLCHRSSRSRLLCLLGGSFTLSSSFSGGWSGRARPLFKSPYCFDVPVQKFPVWHDFTPCGEIS